uniref:Uncharacterized protein n=1 Tax=Cyanothece sp. (strain PCC 7425 / ATCC 29141) TaxID=395961 RepID=B8HNW9_CYAP4
MLTPKLFPLFKIHKLVKSNPEIALKAFVDLDLDLFGYYAIGHHNKRDFLAVVQEQRPGYSLLSVENVQQVWAKFDGNDFVEVDRHAAGAQPITLVVWDDG